MRKTSKISALVISLALAGGTLTTASAQDPGPDGDMGEEHMGEHDGPPPMIALMPPEGTEKPEGVEMTGDPEQDFPMILEVFHRMMDSDGSGELSLDELASWAHPLDGPGPMDEGMMDGGMMDEGMMEEMRRHMEEELRHQIEEEVRHHIDMEMHHEMMERHREHLEQMRHEVEEARQHEQNMIRESEEQQAHMQAELQEIRDHIARMMEEVRHGEEELAREEQEGGAPEE